MNMGAVVASVTWIGFVPWTRLGRLRELEAQVHPAGGRVVRGQGSGGGGAGEEPTSTP